MNRIKGIISFIILICLSFHVQAQDSFTYIQSEDGTPFYVKIEDSLRSSTSAGYLILSDLEPKNYKMVIGLPKGSAAEAAFQIKVEEKEDKGFLLELNDGKLQLKEIVKGDLIEPQAVASSAGNRITGETLGVADAEDIEDSAPGSGGKEGSGTLSFEEMLNAVTGVSNEVPVAEATKPSETEEDDSLEEERGGSVGEIDLAEAEDAGIPSDEIPPVEEPENAAPEDDLLTFDKFLREEERKSSASGVVKDVKEVEKKPANAGQRESKKKVSDDALSFIEFQGEREAPETQEGNLIEEPEPLDVESEEVSEKKRKKRLSFDDLMARMDDLSGKEKESIAKPLLNKDKEEERIPAVSLNCAVQADEDYFSRMYKRVAAKSNPSAMLRTAKKQLNGDVCFTAPQLGKVAYLFASEEDRFEFIKEAYPYCADENGAKELAKTLDSDYLRQEFERFVLQQ